MSSLFNNSSANTSALTSIDGIEDWDTSSVTAMNDMFRSDNSLTSIDVQYKGFSYMQMNFFSIRVSW